MAAELVDLYNDLDPERLRVTRPSKFLFLCGGAVATGDNAKPQNLRDYIYRVRRLRSPYHIVLAEKATQLYRDTDYDDLISFEEDIARIAALVLVIAESAGSLAELGAFASNETILKALRVMIKEKHESDESFIRYGPVERVKKAKWVKKVKREHLGVYPWRDHANGRLVVSSIEPHYTEICNFINDHMESIDDSMLARNLSKETRLFYIVYWIIFLCLAVKPATLSDYVHSILPDTSNIDIRNKIYCMELAGWIKRVSYSGQDYFYVLYDTDPFRYSFRQEVNNRDPIRRKLSVTLALRKKESIPRYITRVATEGRKVAAI